MAGPIKVRIDDLIIDATPEQDYQGDVETTEHPIEDGAEPTDHARAKPETWVATCVVSSVPVDDGDRRQRGEFERYATGGYARGVYQRVKKMKDERKLHVLTTPLRRYENMMITALSSPTRAQYGDGVVFKISFKEIRIVQSGTAQFVTKPTTTNTNKPTTKKNQAKKTGADAEGKRSILKTLTDSTGLTEAGSGL